MRLINRFTKLFACLLHTEDNKQLPDLHPLQVQIKNEMIEAKEQAVIALDLNQDIGKDLQSVIDAAEVTSPMIRFIKPKNAEGLLDIWSATHDQTSYIAQTLEAVSGDTDAVGSSASLSIARTSAIYIPGRFHVDAPGFENAWKPFEAYASRTELRDEVQSLLLDFGLDIPQYPGDRSPLEQFNTAHEAYLMPIDNTDPAITSLIPLRECIHSVLDGLLLRRPNPMKVKKNQKAKVVSIGMQLKHDSLPDDIINEWADEWHDLNTGDLSRAKRKVIDREDWLYRLNRGTAFLHSLLKGIDPHKINI